MGPGLQTTIRYLLSVGTTFLFGLGIGIHHYLEGDPLLPAFLPAVSMTAQTIALSLGERALSRRGWSGWRMLAAALPVSLLFGCITVMLHRWSHDSHARFGLWFPAAGLGVLGFWALVSYFPARLGEAQTRTLAAESERRKAELLHLRSNLHPHFLLNTLNAIAGLFGAEPRQARQLVSALGDLLRDSLEESGGMRTLGEELEWMRRYAQIFEIRHQGAIHFEWDLAEQTRALPVPRLLLQPLLENAINHGALKRPGGGKVSVSSRVEGHVVEIVVSDDGVGMRPHAPDRRGLGMRIVRDRLELAFPGAAMTIDSNEAGTRVALHLPNATARTPQ